MVEKPCYAGGTIQSEGVFGSDLVVFSNYPGSHEDTFLIKYPNYVEDGLFTTIYSPPLCILHKGEIFIVARTTFMIYNLEDESIK